MGQSLWNCENDVWLRVGGIVEMMCGEELVELRRRCVGQSWWNCGDAVWGRIGGNVKMVFGAGLLEL